MTIGLVHVPLLEWWVMIVGWHLFSTNNKCNVWWRCWRIVCWCPKGHRPFRLWSNLKSNSSYVTWMGAEWDRYKGNPTYWQDKVGFLLTNFCYIMANHEEPFISQQVFFIDDDQNLQWKVILHKESWSIHIAMGSIVESNNIDDIAPWLNTTLLMPPITWRMRPWMKVLLKN